MQVSESIALSLPDAPAAPNPTQSGGEIAPTPAELHAHPVRLRGKTLLFSCAPTYAEFVAACTRQDFLEMRGREIRLLPEEQLYFTHYPDLCRWLVVAADDSPDSLVVLPVIAHVAAWVPRLALRVVSEEDAERLLPALTDDTELLASWADADLPLLLSFDEDWQFQETWGPHPQAIDAYLDRWLAEHSEFDRLAEDDSAEGQAAYTRLLEQLLQEMRVWYNTTLNCACAEELMELLARWRNESDENGPEG